jgi:hypothetical protein
MKRALPPVFFDLRNYFRFVRDGRHAPVTTHTLNGECDPKGWVLWNPDLLSDPAKFRFRRVFFVCVSFQLCVEQIGACADWWRGAGHDHGR